jgi:hypothetical protein
MTVLELERRILALEAEVAQLRKAWECSSPSSQRWWEQISGVFAEDKPFEEAMKLGRDYRNSRENLGRGNH